MPALLQGSSREGVSADGPNTQFRWRRLVNLAIFRELSSFAKGRPALNETQRGKSGRFKLAGKLNSAGAWRNWRGGWQTAAGS